MIMISSYTIEYITNCNLTIASRRFVTFSLHAGLQAQYDSVSESFNLYL